MVYPDEGLAVVVLTNLAGANPQRFVGKIAEFYGPLKPAPFLAGRPVKDEALDVPLPVFIKSKAEL